MATSNLSGTEHRRCPYRGFGQSLECAFAPYRARQDLCGYALARFVACRLLWVSFTRPLERDFHIGDSSIVEVIGNHFHFLQPSSSRFCSQTPGLFIREPIPDRAQAMRSLTAIARVTCGLHAFLLAGHA